MTLMHEVGHAIGLKHPAKPQDGGTLTAEYNKMQYTAMTNATPTASGFTAVTPMLLDMVGLEAIYGLRPQNSASNSVYRVEQGPQGPVGMVIVDSGGADDVIDASNTQTGNEIDLRATDFAAGKAYYSSVGVPVRDGATPPTYSKYNVAIYQGSVIENAIGGTGNDEIIGNDADNRLEGGAGNDSLKGEKGADKLFGGDNNDTLDGGEGSDTLEGGAGSDLLKGGTGLDTYVFKDAFGKDTIIDADGLGSISINGQALGQAKAGIQRNTWTAKLGSGSSSQTVSLTVLDNSSSSTGKRLVIRAGSSDNTITIDNFDLAKAMDGGQQGYLGIRLENGRKVALVSSQAAIAVNPFVADPDFDPIAASANSTANILEGAGKTFTAYLSAAAKSGDTLTIGLTGAVAGKLKAVLGDTTVAANGAVIALKPGQTQVRFALVGDAGQPIDADMAGALSVRYAAVEPPAVGGSGSGSGSGSNTASSNSFALTLKDGGEASRTYNGDQRAQLIGIEIDTQITPGQAGYNTYKWSATNWAADGTLTGGVVQADFADVIYAGSGNDKIDGKGGNDALDGGAGNDVIDGGEGDNTFGWSKKRYQFRSCSCRRLLVKTPIRYLKNAQKHPLASAQLLPAYSRQLGLPNRQTQHNH